MKEKGFTLIEVVVGLGILAVVLSAVGSLASQTVRAGAVVRQDLIAANLAQEGLELVRSIRDGNWIADRRADGIGSGAGCRMNGPFSTNWRNRICDRTGGQSWSMDSNDTVLSSGGGSSRLRLNASTGEYEYGGSGTVTPFKREIRITTVTPQQLLVDVTVIWCPNILSANCPANLQRTFTLQSYLYNWVPVL